MNRLKKYAELLIKVGVNLQKNQILVINANIEAKDLVRLLSLKAYENQAKEVIVEYHDDEITRNNYLYKSIETFKIFPKYIKEKYKYFMKEEVATINIISPNTELLKGVDIKKLDVANKTSSKNLKEYSDYMMASKSQWCVAAYPSIAWAKKVYPNLKIDEAKEMLLEDILFCCRVTSDNNTLEEFKEHMYKLEKNANKLTELNFEYLHFKNSLGTDLKVHLVNDHIWAGGIEKALNGVYFGANIPTEEIFTMPNKFKVDGRVYSTKPLVYQGNIINDFYLDFKDGMVVNYDAKEGKEYLELLLNTDKGSKRLGEVALISYDSPISKRNTLFYNTLFDENASCHLALGNAYISNIKNDNNLSVKELEKLGYNVSMVHVDFMFGSKDLEVTGYKKNNEAVKLFLNGNFLKL